MIFSALLFSGSFVQISFGLKDYENISQWGSFGISEPGHFSYPQFIAVDDDGVIYVSDLGNKRVQKFSSTGEFITEWGKNGKQSGEFHYPSGIAVYDNLVFVADRDLNRIQKFSTNGEFISEWGTKGIHDGQFFFPNGLAVNNEIVYVVDTGNQRIQTFSTDGEFISSFGSSGIGPGQFLTAVGIDIDTDGNVYVTDKGNSKIEKFHPTGEFIKSFPFHSSNYPFSPEAIAIDPTGKMFIVNSGNDRILHLSQDSDLRLTVFDQIGPYTNSFDIVSDIAIGINGELLVVDSANHTIKSFETEFYTKPVFVNISYEFIPDLPIDTTKPEITAPISLEIEAIDLSTSVSLGEAIATDESEIKDIINNAPETFFPGVTTIIWVAFDNVGYVSTTTQTVTVKTCGNDHSSYNLIEGTNDDDIIQGTDGDDLIFGLGGNDLISGGSGNDCIFGGNGDDVISGNDGDDVIHSNLGFDVVDGGSNHDRCYDSSDSKTNILINCE